jgi:hypothetical protein
VEWRDLSCFCLACESGLETDLCDNRAHVEKWKLTRMKPKNKYLAREAYMEVNEEIEYGDGGQEMADDVCVGIMWLSNAKPMEKRNIGSSSLISVLTY